MRDRWSRRCLRKRGAVCMGSSRRLADLEDFALLRKRLALADVPTGQHARGTMRAMSHHATISEAREASFPTRSKPPKMLRRGGGRHKRPRSRHFARLLMARDGIRSSASTPGGKRDDTAPYRDAGVFCRRLSQLFVACLGLGLRMNDREKLSRANWWTLFHLKGSIAETTVGEFYITKKPVRCEGLVGSHAESISRAFDGRLSGRRVGWLVRAGGSGEDAREETPL